jgi:ATP-dependent Clp protease ATP-binding subunit ClpC
MNSLHNLFRKQPQPSDNLSPRAQRLLVNAREEANRFSHQYVGTEHLLKGMILLNEGTGCSVLQRLGINLHELNNAIEANIETGSSVSFPNSVEMTSLSKRILNSANKEAITLGQKYLGTEHILAGILIVRSGLAYKLLARKNIELQEVRNEIIFLTTNRAEPSA